MNTLYNCTIKLAIALKQIISNKDITRTLGNLSVVISVVSASVTTISGVMSVVLLRKHPSVDAGRASKRNFPRKYPENAIQPVIAVLQTCPMIAPY